VATPSQAFAIISQLEQFQSWLLRIATKIAEHERRSTFVLCAPPLGAFIRQAAPPLITSKQLSESFAGVGEF
jgi:hypothetical protein